jgi:hypothetical protein
MYVILFQVGITCYDNKQQYKSSTQQYRMKNLTFEVQLTFIIYSVCVCVCVCVCTCVCFVLKSTAGYTVLYELYCLKHSYIVFQIISYHLYFYILSMHTPVIIKPYISRKKLEDVLIFTVYTNVLCFQ